MSLLASLALTTTLSAHAIVPTDEVHQGIEPQRSYEFTPTYQARMLRSPAWQEITQGELQGWTAVFDEASGTPWRAWGRGVWLGPTDTAAQVEDNVWAFIERHPELVGVPLTELRTRSVHHVQRTDTWYVHLDALAAGAPIWRGGVTVRIKHGRMILFGAETFADTPLGGEVQLSPETAVEQSISEGPESFAAHELEDVRLVALPWGQGDDQHLRMAWYTRTRTTDPSGIWVSFVDAHSGELLSVHNEVRHFEEGVVYGVHDTRTVTGDFSTSPMANIQVVGDSAAAYTDWDGLYTLRSDASTATVGLYGNYARVDNYGGTDGSLTLYDGEGTFTTAEATQAEIDSYVFLEHMHDYGVRVAPEVSWSDGTVNSYVNRTDMVCNAYFDGNINFMVGSDDYACNNTGRIADVLYHEWGHGFHYYALPSSMRYTHYDGSISEGIADTTSMLRTRDHLMAPYFMMNGAGIRDLDNSNSYPDDYSDSGDTHYNGLIFGGAMWDLYEVSSAELGDDEAIEWMEQLLADMIPAGPFIPTSYLEALVADDDDGDLENGTPHACLIMEAFSRHGLDPTGGNGVVVAVHEPLDISPVGAGHPIGVEWLDYSGGCIDFEPANAWVTYRVDGGDWQQSDLAVDELSVYGTIPEQAFGSFVEYYIDVRSTEGDKMQAPSGAFSNPYSFYAGDVLEVYCNDFEADDGGFTHELISGDNNEGADDWMWSTPMGLGGDPDGAASGSMAWGNDLGGGNYNGEYQNDKHNRLTSPDYDTAWYQGVFLHYSRWLQIEDGYYDQGQILADGEVVWSNYDSGNQAGGYHHADSQWVPHSVDLQGAGDDGMVNVSFETITDQGLSMGGWTLDDFCLYAPATPDNRLAIVDFATAEADTGIELSWTQPIHAPVERVVVVRKSDAFPTGPTDGTVVHDDYEPEVGASFSVVDPDVQPDTTYYYAAYGFDGQDFLSWTVEGWNAATGLSANGMGEEPGEVELVGSCGCASSSSAGGLAMLLGLIPLLGLRRRR